MSYKTINHIIADSRRQIILKEICSTGEIFHCILLQSQLLGSQFCKLLQYCNGSVNISWTVFPLVKLLLPNERMFMCTYSATMHRAMGHDLLK